MQIFANSVIAIVSGQEYGVISVFLKIALLAALLIAIVNTKLVFSLEKKYNISYNLEISKRKVIGIIILASLLTVLIWLPFDWAKVLCRIFLICAVLYPIFPFVFNKDYYFNPGILSSVACTFLFLIDSNIGIVSPFWNKFFVLANILILFLFFSCYYIVLARNFVKNITMYYRKDDNRLRLSKKPSAFLFYISKIGLVFSVTLTYIVIVYSDGYFSDNFGKIFCFVAEAIIIPNIIMLLQEIKKRA